MDEQHVNDMLQIVSGQREFFANQVVHLQAQLLAAQRIIQSLTPKEEKKDE